MANKPNNFVKYPKSNNRAHASHIVPPNMPLWALRLTGELPSSSLGAEIKLIGMDRYLLVTAL